MKLPERNISIVYRFTNDNVMVFDQYCQQLSDYQGTYSEVKEKILKDADESVRYYHAKWNEYEHEVSKKQF